MEPTRGLRDPDQLDEFPFEQRFGCAFVVRHRAGPVGLVVVKANHEDENRFKRRAEHH